MSDKPHILVIGAGVIGAAIAYNLAPDARVTVLDQGMPGSGASAMGFGWVNASFTETRQYFQLRLAAIAAHHRVDHLTAGITRWGGALWWEDAGAEFDARYAAMQAHDHEVQLLDMAGFEALAPQVANPPARCLFTPTEGGCNGDAFAARLLAASGATLCLGTKVTGLLQAGGTIRGVATNNGPFMADHVILAAGSGSTPLLASLGIALPLETKPGMILHTAPIPARLDQLILAPDIHFRQDPAGRIVAGEIFSGAGASAGQITQNPMALAADIMARLAARLPGQKLSLEKCFLGQRPVPGDGLPMVGHIPGLAGIDLAVMHSGVTLAPIIGELLAAKVLCHRDDPLLRPFRPARLLK